MSIAVNKSCQVLIESKIWLHGALTYARDRKGRLLDYEDRFKLCEQK